MITVQHLMTSFIVAIVFRKILVGENVGEFDECWQITKGFTPKFT